MRQFLAALAAMGALAVVPLSVSGAIASSPPAKRHHHHVRHHHKPRHHGCIPQHNRGDHDADNRGGPSDGDGCM